MAAIDIGDDAINRVQSLSGNYTYILMDNPANDSGTIDTFEIWSVNDLTATKVGTFYGSAPNFTSRDYETIGAVTSGSKQTFSGLDCDVSSGDYAGIWWENSGDYMESDNSASEYYKSGDQFGAGQQTYTLEALTQSLYGTGTTEAAVAGIGARYLQNNPLGLNIISAGGR